jgi:cell division protein FtsL
MFRRPILLFCMLFFVASFGTLLLKVHVQNLATDVESMVEERAKLNNEIQVLKAEWSYLNNAERVGGLANKYLNLDRVKTNQVKYMNQETMPSEEINNEPSKDIRRVNTNWKYKSRTGILKISNRKPGND